MLPVSCVPSLVSEHGLFLGKWGFRERLDRDGISLDEVEMEIKAQYEWFCRYVYFNFTNVLQYNVLKV